MDELLKKEFTSLASYAYLELNSRIEDHTLQTVEYHARKILKFLEDNKISLRDVRKAFPNDGTSSAMAMIWSAALGVGGSRNGYELATESGNFAIAIKEFEEVVIEKKHLR